MLDIYTHVPQLPFFMTVYNWTAHPLYNINNKSNDENTTDLYTTVTTLEAN